MSEEDIFKVVNEAFYLGQVYWRQADSESYKQNAKAAETYEKFVDLKNRISQKLNGLEVKSE